MKRSSQNVFITAKKVGIIVFAGTSSTYIALYERLSL